MVTNAPLTPLLLPSNNAPLSSQWHDPRFLRRTGVAIVVVCLILVAGSIYLWRGKVHTNPKISVYHYSGDSITESDYDTRRVLHIRVDGPSSQGASGELAIISGNTDARAISIEKAKFQFGSCSMSAYNSYLQKQKEASQRDQEQTSGGVRIEEIGSSLLLQPPGCSQTVEAELVVKADKAQQEKQEITIGFKNLRNLTLGEHPTVKLTILDNDAPLNGGVPPTLRFAQNPLTIKEDIAVGSSHTIEVKLSHLSSFPISFKLNRKSGAEPGTDVFWTHDVKVPAKQSSGYAGISATNDKVCKPNREVVLTFDAVENAVIPENASDQDLRVIITDDDCM